ncbi:MAG: hypothetical protein KKH12_10820 [Gammaproteobacteria bacterium]|nr:hypothetical protein [Gammaproteobacteria bacterium]MBU1482149.1 hypothetical protein [Gammaproteobacteria bacterium]
MKIKKYVATLEQVGEVIRHIDLSPLENRLVGKPLVELEHCLIEITGELTDIHLTYKEFAVRLAQDCIEATSRDEFFFAYREYKKEKSSFATDYSLGSKIGYYFAALLDRLTDIQRKQDQAGKKITVSHARMLSYFLVQEIERMWKSSQYTNEKVEQIWEHWIKC